MKPEVWGMMLHDGTRPQMARRVILDMLHQAYAIEPLAFDTSELKGKPIGTMRNAACRYIAETASPGAPVVVVHFDSDDWSHPQRVAEQVAWLQKSGAPLVSYSEMLFWDQMRMRHEAWIYKSFNPSVGLGASFCYWLDTWKRRPFTELNTPEDTYWQQHGIVGCPVSSIVEGRPRMICRLHPGSTPEGKEPLPPHGKRIPDVREWTRAEQWDRYCKERM